MWFHLFIPYVRTKSRPLGWLAAWCRHCEQVQAMHCSQLTKSTNLAFVLEVSAKPLGIASTCDFCGTTYQDEGLPALRVVPWWSPEQGLEELIDGTNPDLGRVARPPQRTRRELHALLVSIARRTSAMRVGFQWGTLLAIVPAALFAFLGAMVGLYYREAHAIKDPDEFGCGLMGATIGLFVGGIGGCLGWALLHTHTGARRLLKKAIQRHGLSLTRLYEVAVQSSDVPSRIVNLVNRMQHSHPGL